MTHPTGACGAILPGVSTERDEPPFEIRASPMQGSGAFATRFIPRGYRLIEYAGARLTPAEADAKYPDVAGERHHTFLFAIDDEVVIDAAVDGNEARFINHSCDPNAEAFIPRGRIWIEAIKPIPKGAEIAYDYAFEDDPKYTLEDYRRYGCRCGAKNCRGTIVETKKKLNL